MLAFDITIMAQAGVMAAGVIAAIVAAIIVGTVRSRRLQRQDRAARARQDRLRVMGA